MTTRAVGWTEPTAVGVTPEAAFSSMAGSCSAPFSWNASGFHEAGDTQMHLDLELDQESARLHEPGEDGAADGCETTLTIEAHLRVRTEDGLLVDEVDVTIAHRGLLRFMRAADEVGGTISLGSTTAKLRYELDGAGENCAGTVSVSEPGSSDEIGAWSASGCPPGEQLRELQEAVGQGNSLSRARIDETLADVRLDGTWEDGTRTTLTLSAKLAGTQACAEGLGLELPLDVRYGTEDGVIATHEVRTTLGLIPSASSEEFSFGLTDRHVCKDEADDTLPYTPADCGVVTDVTFNFGVRYTNGSFIAGDDGLIVFENLRRAEADGDLQRKGAIFAFDVTE